MNLLTHIRDWLLNLTVRERDCWRFKYEAEHEYAQRLEVIQRDTYTSYLNTLGELAETRRQLDVASAYQRAIETGISVNQARAAIEAEAREAEIEAQRARQAREDESFYGRER